MMADLRAAAQFYAGLGIPVFPCLPRDKRPHGKLVPHGLKDATTDRAVIARWWLAEPDANIGLPTGLTFDALDVDGELGMQALAEAMPLAEIADDDPVLIGPTVTTGRGCHVYMSPTGIGNRAGVLPHIDYRGAGGYVVAPPSVHPSGATYYWHLAADDPDYGASAPLRPAPAWLLELLSRRRAPVTLPGARPSSANVSAYGRRSLESECGKVVLARVGERNDALNRAAFSLGQLVAGGVLDIDAVIDALLVAAVRAGLGEDESRKTIASGLRSGAASPRSVPA